MSDESLYVKIVKQNSVAVILPDKLSILIEVCSGDEYTNFRVTGISDDPVEIKVDEDYNKSYNNKSLRFIVNHKNESSK
jgi:hypothetical protein